MGGPRRGRVKCLAPDEVSCEEERWDGDSVILRTSPTTTTLWSAHRHLENKDAQKMGSQQWGLLLTGESFHI